MRQLLNELKDKNRTTTFAVTAFIAVIALADYLNFSRSYTDTILKGNRSYFDNFLEAFYMKDHGMNPYTESLYFAQNYFVYQLLYRIRQYPALLKLLQVLFVIFFAALLGQVVGISKRAKTNITALALLNPVTVLIRLNNKIYFYREQVLTFFDLTVILAPVYFLRVQKKFATSAVLFGLALYFNPRSIVFLSVLTQTFSDRGTLNKRPFLVFILLAGSVASLLYAATEFFSGMDSMMRLVKPSLTLNYLIPDIGNHFDSFSMIFESHIEVFGLMLTVTPVFTVIPTMAYFQSLLGRVAENPEIYYLFNQYATALELSVAVLFFLSLHSTITVSTIMMSCLLPFIGLAWQDFRKVWVDRNQLTYGREFEVKMIFYIILVLAVRYQLALNDKLGYAQRQEDPVKQSPVPLEATSPKEVPEAEVGSQ